MHDRVRHVGRCRGTTCGKSLKQPVPRKAAGSRQERPDSKWKPRGHEVGQPGICIRSASPEPGMPLPICVGLSESRDFRSPTGHACSTQGEDPRVEQVPQSTSKAFQSTAAACLSATIQYELHPEPRSRTIQLPLLLTGSQIAAQLVTHATGFGPIK